MATIATRTATPADIVDAVTRREFLGLVAACGDDDDKKAARAAATARTVRTDAGIVEVPAEPRRAVAAIGSFETS